MTVRGTNVFLDVDGSVFFTSGITVNGDGANGQNGSGHACYAPPTWSGTALDDLENAGHPGNWWGIATDRRGNPIVQGQFDPAPGAYVSTTALNIPGYADGTPGRYVDSEAVPGIVVPGSLARMVPGIVLGCRAQVERLDRNISVPAVVFDTGPATHLGEGSIALAKALGINPSPKTGGDDSAIYFYRFWPGVAAPGFALQRL
jgi:hypothetical protein